MEIAAWQRPLIHWLVEVPHASDLRQSTAAPMFMIEAWTWSGNGYAKLALRWLLDTRRRGPPGVCTVGGRFAQHRITDVLEIPDVFFLFGAARCEAAELGFLKI